MTDVMISYSRRDGEFVKRLYQSLLAQERDIWVDWEDIPLTADWWAEISGAIEAAASVVIVLSPDSVGSPICQMEVDHALAHNKRLIPIIRRDCNLEGALAGVKDRGLDDNARSALNGRDIFEITRENWNQVAKLNWIFFKDDATFDTEFAKLSDSIDADLEHSREHTRLIVRASEWERKGRNASFLLEGVEIEEAEHWLTAGMSKEPMPTELQAEYINLSRERATAQQRKLMAGVTSALVISVVLMALSVYLYFQSEEDRKLANQSASTAVAAEATAQEDANRALSLVLSTSAQLELDDFNTDLAVALALEAQGIEPLSQVQRTLAQAAYAPGTFQVIAAHSETVAATVSLPDGRRALSSATDGTIKLWDLTDGSLLVAYVGHQSSVNALAINGDATRFVSGSSDGTLRVWDLETGEPLVTFGRVDGPAIHAVAFDPDGEWVLSGGANKAINMWDLETGELSGTLEANDFLYGDVLSLAVNESGTQALSGGGRGELIVWDLINLVELKRLAGGASTVVNSVAFSPGGALALVGGSAGDNSVYIWDIEAAEIVKQFKGHGDIVYAVAFAPDNETIISGSQDGSMRLWSIETEQEVWRFSGHRGGLRAVAYLPDSMTAISGSFDGTVRHWALNNGAQLSRYEGHTAAVYDARISDDGRYVVSGGRDNVLRLWDAESATVVHEFEPQHADAIWAAAISPDGTRLLSGVRDGSARLWSMDTRQVICEMAVDPEGILGHSARVWDAAFSPEGDTLVTVSGDGTARLWNGFDCSHIRTFTGHEGHVRAVAFSPDGESFVTGGQDMVLIHWSVETGEIGRFDGHQDWLWTIDFSPNGRVLASGSSDGAIILWDVDQHRAVRVIDEVTGSTTGLDFSPDGRLLASAAGDGIVRLWDITTGGELRRFQGHQGGVWAVHFAPDGATLISASGDDTLILWRASVSLQELVEWTFANRYVREMTCNERIQYNAPNDDCIIKEGESGGGVPTPEPADAAELIALAP